MKKVYVLLICMLLSASLQAQTAVHPADTLCLDLTSPRLLLKGAQLKLSCDSVYLISPARYRLYQRLHQHMLDIPAEGQYEPVLEAYDQALSDTQRAYEELLSHYRQTDMLAQQWAESSHVSLEKMLHTVRHAEQTLTEANEQLAETRQLLKKEKHRQLWTRILLGAGGVGMGYLLAR